MKLDNPLAKWDKIMHALSNANNKALKAIFFAISSDEFHKVSLTETTNEAWDILGTTHEGTKKVKDTKLQALTTKFKELRISKDEPFDAFNFKLNDIMNST